MASLLKRYGPSAVVAGASEEVGAAFAQVLAEAGFRLVLIARQTDRLVPFATTLEARYGQRVETIALDLAAPDLEPRLDAIAREHGAGLLVYNAALSIAAPFLDAALADKQRILDVNARGPLIAAHVFGRYFAARGGGGIVLLSSLGTFRRSARVATYGATRAFDLSLADSLARELGELGIDVVASCAGATRTPGLVQVTSGRKAPRSMSHEMFARETLAALPGRAAFMPRVIQRVARRIWSRLLPQRAMHEINSGETKSLS